MTGTPQLHRAGPALLQRARDLRPLIEREAGERSASAAALVHRTWDDTERVLESGARLDVRQETLLRLALNHITSTVAEVARFVYASGGTSALREGPIQRLFRDVHAGTAHITSGPAALAECGRELAGLAPGHAWVVLGLEA
ncbi:hypothetical protein ACWDA3_28680 [Nonomuraea rubra]